MLFALLRKKPLDLIICSSSAWSASAKSRAVLYFLKRAGVMVLIILSVLCADRIVAIRSWSGFSWSRAHFASGYAAWRRVKICSARKYLFFFAARFGVAFFFAGFFAAFAVAATAGFLAAI